MILVYAYISKILKSFQLKWKHYYKILIFVQQLVNQLQKTFYRCYFIHLIEFDVKG